MLRYFYRKFREYLSDYKPLRVSNCRPNKNTGRFFDLLLRQLNDPTWTSAITNTFLHPSPSLADSFVLSFSSTNCTPFFTVSIWLVYCRTASSVWILLKIPPMWLWRPNIRFLSSHNRSNLLLVRTLGFLYKPVHYRLVVSFPCKLYHCMRGGQVFSLNFSVVLRSVPH